MQTYDPSQSTRFGQILARRARELRTALGSAHPATDAGSAAPWREVLDFKDMAAQDSWASLAEVTAAQAARELALVLAAQRRLQDRDYGLCLDCGEPIDLRRLLALPATPNCIACQDRQEQRRATTTYRHGASAA